MTGSRKHPLAKCEECPLNEVGKYVPSQIPQTGKAQLAFVGEAPGIQEARSGRPFSGPSGDLLNNVIRHHRINRNEVVLTNACLCRPPDNATPPAAAIKACKPRLVGELELASVTTAVALGNTAAQALTGRSGVTKLRVGSGIPSDFDPGLRVVSTLHPAYCLRNADGFPSLVIDIGKAVNPGATFTPPRYRVVTDPIEAGRVLRTFLGGEGSVVVDIETDVEKDVGFGHPNQHRMLCVGVTARGRTRYVFAESALGKAFYALLRLVCLRRGVSAQNGKFDLAGLFRFIGAVPLVFDTLLASYACDERPGIHGLKIQAQEYLGAPPYDDEVKKYVGAGEGYGAIPRHILYKYNAYDIHCTDLLQEMYERRFSNDANGKRLHDFLVAASEQLMFVELNGLAVDLEYLKVLEKRFQASLRELEQRLDIQLKENPKAPVDFINPRSPQQVKRVLHSLGMRVASTNKETLYKIQDYCKDLAKTKNTVPENFPIYNFVTTLLEHRKEAKLYGTYVKGIRKRLYRGRVYPTFLIHGTTTGRLSCRNPNLQNIVRGSDIRDMFVPARAGNLFIQSDFSQAELRVLTWLAKCIYFRDIFNAGDIDLFDELTPVLYPRLAPKSRVHPGEWKEIRIRVKAFVYGLGYGRGEGSIADEFKIPYSEALALKRNFFSVIPEIVQWQAGIQDAVFSGQDLKTPFGRSRRFGLITPLNKHEVEKEALAFMPQSISSDITLGAMVNVRKDLRGIGWVRNIIHDAILSEAAPENASRVADIQNVRMLESAQLVVGDYVKFATESKTGPNWGSV